MPKTKRNVALTTRGRGPGRPISFTADARDIIERLAASGASLETIGAALGVSSGTVSEVARREPEVQDALDRGHGALETELVGHLLQHAREGNVTAAIFLLKGKRHWRDSTPVEPKDPGKSNITLVLPAAASPEDYARQIISANPDLSKGEQNGNT